jgi:hypothetical protein
VRRGKSGFDEVMVELFGQTRTAMKRSAEAAQTISGVAMQEVVPIAN